MYIMQPKQWRARAETKAKQGEGVGGCSLFTQAWITLSL